MIGRASRQTLSALLAALLYGGVWLACGPASPLRLTLRLHPFVGAERLRLNEMRYANPGGAGAFEVRDFQFFLSNVRLTAGATEFREPDSYHLVRFDGGDGTFEIVLEGVPRAAYERLDFGIGVDAAANGSVAAVGDLDANGRMAWGWEIGYKFVLFEGGLAVGDTRYPLVYHVGFDENYERASIDLDASRFAGSAASIELRVDLLRMFAGGEPVDMAALPNVKFDRADAKRLADNFASMISLCRSDCGP